MTLFQFQRTNITRTTEEMDRYMMDKHGTGIIQNCDTGPDGFRYTRRYGNSEWSAVSPTVHRRSSGLDTGPTRFWQAHGGSFSRILMPELDRIAREKEGCILVQPYLPVSATTHLPLLPPRSYVNNKFWRLEVDEEKEREGVWEFRPEIPVHCDTRLYLKLSVILCNDGAPGARVDQ